MPERYTTGTGQVMMVHDAGLCRGQFCCIHNPSDHVMRDFPTHWRGDRGLMERICPHGVGHPDPDGLEAAFIMNGEDAVKTLSTHGCDGCCHER